MKKPSTTTTKQLRALFAELDYSTLGPLYCDEGGAAFWEAHREPALALGLVWAGALRSRLKRGGTSLYVGAGVAELPALVTEVLDLDRQVHVCSVSDAECESLNASLASTGLADRLQYCCQDGVQAAAAGGFDHLSLISVLNDPENYPAVSGLSYGRVPPVLLDLEALAREREILMVLVQTLLRSLHLPAMVTTTFEEAPWILAAADVLGLAVDAEDESIETAIVGDPLGFLRVR